MCVILYKPSGVKPPKKDILRKCWDNNPDGAGLMYNDGTHIMTLKGYSNFKDFIKTYNNILKLPNINNMELAIHFRIATHGGINKECTHPFKISEDVDTMRQLYNYSNDNTCYLMHNGIIPGYGKSNYTSYSTYNPLTKTWSTKKEDAETKPLSDTMDYASKILSKINNIMKQQPLINALANEHNSRFLIMNKNNAILGGNWYNEHGQHININKPITEIIYSNTNWNIDRTYTLLKNNPYFYTNYLKNRVKKKTPKETTSLLCENCSSEKATKKYDGLDLCDLCYDFIKEDREEKRHIYSYMWD